MSGEEREEDAETRGDGETETEEEAETTEDEDEHDDENCKDPPQRSAGALGYFVFRGRAPDRCGGQAGL
jgi:hypothetical protein